MFVVMNLFAGILFFYMCVLEIYNLNHCIPFFFSGRGGGGGSFKSLAVKI